MNLRTDTWKSFYLKDLYVVKMGNGFDKNKMTDEMPSVNFVSRISYNNGVDCKVDIFRGGRTISGWGDDSGIGW